jgi:hypothetical protein
VAEFSRYASIGLLMKLNYLFLILILIIVSCAPVRTVRQQDLQAWVGVPVEALDLHSFFLTLPMVKTKTESGIEVRLYPNKRNIGVCFGGGGIFTTTTLNHAAFNSFKTCSAGLVGCDNIFYIKDRKVIEYIPVGNCFTDERVQPEKRYKKLISQ